LKTNIVKKHEQLELMIFTKLAQTLQIFSNYTQIIRRAF
jgi:hypothetical protein